VNKYFILPILAITTLSTNAYSNFGLGFSLQSGNSNIVQMPINLSDNYLIEPFIAYSHSDVSHSYTQKDTSYTLGTGIFKRNKSFENSDIIYGVKLAYGVVDSRFESEGTGVSTIQDYNVLTVSPTVGFEYFFNTTISIGGRVSLDYSQYSGTVIGDKYDGNTLDTSTTLSLNYYFN